MWRIPEIQKKAGSEWRGIILPILASSWLAGILAASLHTFTPTLWLFVAGFLALILMVTWRDVSWRLLVCMLLCGCGGGWRYSISHPIHNPLAIAHFVGAKNVTVRGVVIEEPKLQGYGYTRALMIEVDGIKFAQDEPWQTVQGELQLQTEGNVRQDPYGANYGDKIEITGSIRPPVHSHPGIFASMNTTRIRVGDHLGNPIIDFLYNLRNTLAIHISRLLPQPEAAVLTAILLGLRTPAIKPLSHAFNVTGTAHIIAPSGFKVTILAGLITTAAKRLYEQRYQRELPRQRLFNKKRWFTTLFVITCIAGYAILSGAGAAAIRAGIMGSLLVLAPRINRTYNVYASLAFAAMMMSMFDPFILWDVGFLLSFLGTLGIVLFTPYFQIIFKPLTKLPCGNYLAEQFSVTMAAQVATLPVFVVAFQQVSVISPIANTLTTAFLEPILVVGVFIAATSLLWQPLAVLGAWVAWPLVRLNDYGIIWCESIPGAYFTIDTVDASLHMASWLYYALLSFVAVLLIKKYPLSAATQYAHYIHQKAGKQQWRMLVVSCACVIIISTAIATQIPAVHHALTITFFAVGPVDQPVQGQAILLHTPDNKYVLIDGGLDSVSLSQYLDERMPHWQRFLDVVILTSPRSEHITGLVDIVSRYQIGTILDAGMLHADTTYTLWRRTISERNLHYQRVVKGQTMPIGTQLQVQILWPNKQLNKGPNEVRDNSMIVRLVTPGARILLLGAGAQSRHTLSELHKAYNRDDIAADIVQIVGESKTPWLTELTKFIQKVQPATIIVTPAILQGQQKQEMWLGTYKAEPLPIILNIQTLQTEFAGPLQIVSDRSGWRIQSVERIKAYKSV